MTTPELIPDNNEARCACLALYRYLEACQPDLLTAGDPVPPKSRSIFNSPNPVSRIPLRLRAEDPEARNYEVWFNGLRVEGVVAYDLEHGWFERYDDETQKLRPRLSPVQWELTARGLRAVPFTDTALIRREYADFAVRRKRETTPSA